MRIGTLLLATALSASGCAVGPDYKTPPPPATKGYAPEPIPAVTDAADDRLGQAQHFVAGADIPGQWWTLFHSKPLVSLVERALQANPTLDAAQAALRQAREATYAQQGSYFPQVDGSFNVSRNKTATQSLSAASASGNPYYSLATLQLNVSFTPDVFGLNRRTVESLAAQEENQRYQLEATYLTLTSNVVAAALQEASLRAQILVAEDTIRIDSALAETLRKQFTLGQIAMDGVLAQEAVLATEQQALPPLKRQLAQQRDLIAALAGRYPDDGSLETFDLAGFDLPLDIPVSLPSGVVEQRPDVLAAAATLHSASAQIGVAIANRLPQFPLTAQGGSAANEINNLFTPGTGFWTLAAGLTQPIFEGGTLLHRQRGAQAAYDQAAAQYRSTVIAALQNVADALHALQYDADTLQAATVAARASVASLGIARRQVELGATSFLTVLNAEQANFTARLALVQAQALRLADTAALFQALGGGWWNRSDPQPPTTRAGDVLSVIGIR